MEQWLFLFFLTFSRLQENKLLYVSGKLAKLQHEH